MMADDTQDLLRLADEVLADGWLVEWQRQGETWVEAFANEVSALDRAKQWGGACTPLYRKASGHVSVPVQPDRKMTLAGCAVSLVPLAEVNAIYRAMLAVVLRAHSTKESDNG